MRIGKLAGATLAACQQSETSIKIGFSDPLSGAFANVGAHGRRELQLVIEDINQRGGLLGGRKKRRPRFSAAFSFAAGAPTCASLRREERCNGFFRNLHAIYESGEKTVD
jgi:branched-chain amino acid transport system substrate-binding protein